MMQKFAKLGILDVAGICLGRAVVLGGDEPEDDFGDDLVVLVADSLTPEEVLAIDCETVCGIVTTHGGPTDPAGIVAAGKGLIGVLGYADAPAIRTGDRLVLDGGCGTVVVNPDSDALVSYQSKRDLYKSANEKMARYQYLPPETRDGGKLEVLASIDLVDAVAPAIVSGASGIGLLRSEFYYLTGDGAPDEEFLFSLYQHALASVAPLPVTIRCLDLWGGATIEGMAGNLCQNPALGLKGARFCPVHSGLFTTQLRALLRASSFGKLRILLPMIGSFDELVAVKSQIVDIREGLQRGGVDASDDLEIGMMVEVPSAAIMAADLAPELDFLLIGMNDLTQYTLAIDRTCHSVSHLYDPVHPALLRLIEQVVQGGHNAGIEVGLCGEMASRALYAPLLLGLGLDWISVQPSAIGRVKGMIRASRSEACRPFVRQLMGMGSARMMRDCLHRYVHNHYADFLEGALQA